MSDLTEQPATPDLQFDTIVRSDAGTGASASTATCAACHRRINDVYYDVNGVTVCAGCRVTALSLTETPKGVAPLVKAGLCGLGAGIVGATIYYAVMALANLEIGIVAILIGYMVGWGVRKGAANHGGRRFQILAVALTYASIAMAYSPGLVTGVRQARQEQQPSAAAGATPGNQIPARTPVTRDATSALTPGQFVLGFVGLFGIIAALPVIVIFSSMPSGLISAAIIFFGMRQAWAMTAAPAIKVNGPYRVGGSMTSAPA